MTCGMASYFSGGSWVIIVERDMVFILDEGSVFDAPLEKIWKLMFSHAEHNHPSMRNFKVDPSGDPSSFLASWKSEYQGSMVPFKVKFVYFPPVGFAMDYLEGPLAGSKEFEYYTPMGDKTGITCVGEFKAVRMSDDQLRAAVMYFYDKVFREDQDNLAQMK
jgi:hypothetical protein